MNDLQFAEHDIIKNIRQFVSVSKCRCGDGIWCWKCIFEEKLQYLDDIKATSALKSLPQSNIRKALENIDVP